MNCPFCKKGTTRVLESRQSEGSLRRRRACQKCGKRYTTYERIETTNMLVVKRDGTRQLFSREKLHKGILKSCEKRPVSGQQIEKMLDKIEERVKSHKGRELSSTKVGEIVMRELKKLDKVAYIRFASVYLDFKDPEDFEEATRKFRRKK